MNFITYYNGHIVHSLYLIEWGMNVHEFYYIL